MRVSVQKTINRARAVPIGSYLIVVALVAVTLTRLVLVSRQGMTGYGGALEDDTLFVKLGFYIQHGLWLGPFDRLTFAKGPAYPMWIALVSALGAPLLLAEQTLYTASCALLAWVVRPVLRSWKAAAALYLVLLLSPVFFADGIATRAIREGIYVSLTLLVAASAIALWTRAGRSPRAWAGWAVALGVSAAAFWLTREEGVWFAPILLMPASTVALALGGKRRDWARAWRGLAPWGVAAGIGLLCVGAIAANNSRIYGTFTTVDTSSGPFVNAYGALTRIVPDHWVADVPVTRDARQKAYGVSPSFAQLAPSLEGTIGVTWTKIGGGSDLRGGWFMWALRDAAEFNGHYATATEAETYFQRVADEINAACDAGRVPNLPRRATLMPPWHGEYWAPFGSACWRSVRTLATWDGISPVASPSAIPTAVAGNFRAMTHESQVGYDPVPPLRPVTTKVLTADLAVYRWLMPIAMIVGLIGSALAIAQAASKGRSGRTIATVVLLATLVASMAARVVVVSLIDATSFAAVAPNYLAPAYDLALAWAFISGAILVGDVRKRLSVRPRS